MTPIDGSNKATASSVKLTDNGQLIKESLQNFENAVKNVSVQKTYVGAQAAKADKQLDNIRIRQTAIDAEVARLSDADLKFISDKFTNSYDNERCSPTGFC